MSRVRTPAAELVLGHFVTSEETMYLLAVTPPPLPRQPLCFLSLRTACFSGSFGHRASALPPFRRLMTLGLPVDGCHVPFTQLMDIWVVSTSCFSLQIMLFVHSGQVFVRTYGFFSFECS